jgi:hypothetical protein
MTQKWAAERQPVPGAGPQGHMQHRQETRVTVERARNSIFLKTEVRTPKAFEKSAAKGRHSHRAALTSSQGRGSENAGAPGSRNLFRTP